MKTSTRLILILTILVGVIMAIGSYFRLRQRENILRQGMRNEMSAQATTLQLALETLYRSGSTQEAQFVLDSLSQHPRVSGIIIYDDAGIVKQDAGKLSDSIANLNLTEIRQVALTGQWKEIIRQTASGEVFSLLTPMRLENGKLGVLELAQTTSFINAERGRARKDVALVSVPLLIAILIAVLKVMRFSLVEPINDLLRGAAALGRGDLHYRVKETKHSSELAQLAREFNRMADNLAEQRKSVELQTERRIQLERELRETERLAAVGRLAAGVAHEIGTPLNVIDARAEQLLERVDAALPARQRNLTIIRTQTERITRIVRQLLNLARPYLINRQPVEVRQLVNGVLELIEASAANAGIGISVKESEVVCLDVDRELIHQVLLNICQNALQAMGNSGQLTIEFPGGHLLRNEIRFAAIIVKDTGPGIAPENLANIFDPFFTTKDIGSGTGLGLAVSRRIVEEHGGWIVASNMPGGGANFTVYLPVAETASKSYYDQSTLTHC